ncbi:MAG: DUF1150 family protein [Pseudorhodoplanes sp.]
MSASVNRTLAVTSTPSRDVATLAWRNLAYIRVARSEDVGFFCPEAPLLAPGQQVFVVYAADGTPIFVTDSHESAVANAASEELEAMSLH